MIINFVLNISDSVAALLKKINKKIKNNARRSENSGISLLLIGNLKCYIKILYSGHNWSFWIKEEEEEEKVTFYNNEWMHE